MDRSFVRIDTSISHGLEEKDRDLKHGQDWGRTGTMKSAHPLIPLLSSAPKCRSMLSLQLEMMAPIAASIAHPSPLQFGGPAHQLETGHLMMMMMMLS